MGTSGVPQRRRYLARGAFGHSHRQMICSNLGRSRYPFFSVMTICQGASEEPVAKVAAHERGLNASRISSWVSTLARQSTSVSAIVSAPFQRHQERTSGRSTLPFGQQAAEHCSVLRVRRRHVVVVPDAQRLETRRLRDASSLDRELRPVVRVSRTDGDA